ncbi:hypothetical protein K435DRAFT_796005 [Dendrothele bispora CBS 962.96]|uniref:Uncharacterized protein n=1 Tax=Dendrothele bispora (strain CBS 962.96) TaxID=1314807 RepID=A0A4S8M709_DENBC|nr:hypothetical protein K435DRAFT_796005 [Dendrothele bispora CBS 962.96]
MAQMKNESGYVGGLQCELYNPSTGETFKYNFGNRIAAGKETKEYQFNDINDLKVRNGWQLRFGIDVALASDHWDKNYSFKIDTSESNVIWLRASKPITGMEQPPMHSSGSTNITVKRLAASTRIVEELRKVILLINAPLYDRISAMSLSSRKQVYSRSRGHPWSLWYKIKHWIQIYHLEVQQSRRRGVIEVERSDQLRI